MGCRRPRKDDMIAKMVEGRDVVCVSCAGAWGDRGAGRCNAPGEVWIDDDGAYLLLCDAHRRAGLGLTSGEKTKRRKGFKEAQVELIPGLLSKVKATPHE